jgi:hypothetical protein
MDLASMRMVLPNWLMTLSSLVSSNEVNAGHLSDLAGGHQDQIPKMGIPQK